MNIQEINKFLEPLRRQPIDMGDIDLLLQLIKQHDYKFDKDEIVEIYTRISHPKYGFFLTPNKIAELISVIAQIYNPKSVIDICCGIGNILSYFKNLETIKGLDINKSSIQLAEYINPNADFSVADAIEYNFGTTKYDLVVGQLPFGARTIDKRPLNVELIKKGLRLLNDNGVAIFTVNDGLLFCGSRIETEFRQQLLSDFSLDMIISLPSGAFHPYTGIKTSVIVIRNGKKKQDVFMPEFEDNSVEIKNNFKQHKGRFYVKKSEITDNLSRNYYISSKEIEDTLGNNKTIKLGGVSEIIRGKSLEPKSFKKNGKYLSFNRKDKDGNNYIDDIKDKNCILKQDDIVICLVGTNNKIYFHKYDNTKIVITNNYAIVRPTEDNKYISTYLQTEDGLNLLRQQINRNLKGSAMQSINITELSNIEIPLLPLDELNRLVSKSVESYQNKFSFLQEFAQNIKNRQYDIARCCIKNSDTFKNANEEEIESLESLANIVQDIEKKDQKLELEIKKKEALQNRMQKLVEQFTHSLGNVIFPDTIYQVAERLKNLPECRRDTLLLHEAYHAEIIIKLQAELLRHRYGNKEPESFRNMIRKCRRNSNSSDKIKSIEDILNYAVSRATARFLNQHYAGLETIRNKILSQNNTELNQLKQKFEDDILLHNCLSPMEWVSKNLRPIQITQISPLWKKIFILADSYAEALLFGYFSEILFNALKYADHDNKEFLTLSFTETNINDNVYLLSNWSNPTTKQKLPELGTNKGLEAIAEDLKQLNDTESPEESLLISQQANQFQVTLFFKKDLLIDDLPILTRKRKVTENNHA